MATVRSQHTESNNSSVINSFTQTLSSHRSVVHSKLWGLLQLNSTVVLCLSHTKGIQVFLNHINISALFKMMLCSHPALIIYSFSQAWLYKALLSPVPEESQSLLQLSHLSDNITCCWPVPYSSFSSSRVIFPSFPRLDFTKASNQHESKFGRADLWSPSSLCELLSRTTAFPCYSHLQLLFPWQHTRPAGPGAQTHQSCRALSRLFLKKCIWYIP